MKSFPALNILSPFANSNRYSYKHRKVIIITNINLHTYVDIYLTDRAIKAYGRFPIKFYEKHYRAGIS